MRKKSLLVILLILGPFYVTLESLADWSAAKRLTWTSGYSWKPAMAIDLNDYVHVVWHDDTPGASEIYYKRSTDGGASWSAVERLTWTLGGSYDPAIAADSNNHIHVVWEDFTPGDPEIYYKKSTDGGVSWSAVKRLTWTSSWSLFPALAIDSNNHIHVVWHDFTPGAPEIYYRRSMDGGASWSAVERLTWTLGNSEHPAMAADSNNHIDVVWHDFTPGAPEIYYKRSTDGGASWSVVKRLTWTLGNSYEPAMAAVSNNHIHVVWEDFTPGAAEIYYKRSTDGGASWGVVERLTWRSGHCGPPAMAADSNNHIHVVWHDNTTDCYEIHYLRSTDAGTSWSAVKRLTWTSLRSESPAIAIDSNNTIHVVWECFIGLNSEIYYKKGN